MVAMKSTTLATVAFLAGAAQAGAPVHYITSYGDGGLYRYRVECNAYRDSYCQEFVHALNSAACGSFQHNWQAYQSGSDYVFDVSVIAGSGGAASITCAINSVTGQGAYVDGLCGSNDNQGHYEPNGIDLVTCHS